MPSFCLKISVYIVIFIAAITGPCPSFASERCQDGLARIVSVQGIVQARGSGESRWVEMKLDDVLCAGDMIRVQESSRAALLLRNEAIIRIDQNTVVTLLRTEIERTISVDFLSGVALFFSRFPFSLRIFTPFVNANTEGTEFLVQVGKSETLLSVYEGKVSASNSAGGLTLQKGQTAVAGAGELPALRVTAHPRDAVNWALYYPPIPSGDLKDLLSESEPWSRDVRESLELQRKGDLAGAFAALRKVRPDTGSPAFYSYRALLYLSVGRFEEAGSDLEAALSLDPVYSYALSLKSLIALVQNKKDAAFELAQKAVACNSSSSAALIALSYVQQARFDLEGAFSNVERAVRADPEDGLIRARLAELWLSRGYVDEALEAAREAVARNPEVARTQTVLGYAYLTQIRIDDSKRVFRKAILLDQADPLARLGLGLALIRDGDLKAGRTEIEIAAMLDPNNSLIRSYLGKAYYEEKEEKKAADEFALSKQLDPLDPTPWLYDAMLKQSVNRPTEALQNLQKSIELNGNRAVYRSSLLLDQDLAMRSAELARIYDNLGFSQLSLVEGLKSLNTDPANYSAHRFLADFYAFLPRHELARVSETLQSKLLQPININPIRPQLSESKLFMMDGAGPENPSFNEYDALFTRNRFALLHSGLAGENGTLSEEVVQSGVVGRASYSLGQYHYQTDGIRPNNDLNNNIYDAFGQVSLSAKTSIQAEYRNRNTSFGDLGIRFDPANFDGTRREQLDVEEERFGLHHIFTPNSEFIGSFIHSELGRGINVPLFGYGNSSEIVGNLGEVQYLYRSQLLRLVCGAGYLQEDLESQFSLIRGPTFPKTGLLTTDANLYVYSLLSFPDHFTWTIGGSADFYNEDGGKRENEFNPKLGVTWNPFPSTTLRAAGFRTFQRPELTGETIEPTQVAGFNQIFEDAKAARTKTWREGVGLDQKFTDTLFGGIEFSRRDIDWPYFGGSPPSSLTASWEDNIVRTYLYWAFCTRLTASLEFQYENLDRGEGTIDYFDKITTYRVPFGFNFFHPSGFFAKMRPTFIHQEGHFSSLLSDRFSSQQDTFVYLDASVGWLLPRRWGIVSLEARNLFDQSFRFEDTDPSNPTVSPQRFIFLRYTLAF